MAMKVATAAISTNSQFGRGLRGLYSSLSSFPFNLPKTNVEKPPPAEPSTNLFVSGGGAREGGSSYIQFMSIDFICIGLSKRTTTEGLHSAFAKFGEVVHAKVVCDHVSGYSKGFGFVKYATLEDAEAGIKGMDGQ
ncbi:hypothetical protein OROGR_012370 [Orobanche gracilis]